MGSINLEQLAIQSEGFSGSEIEQAVVSALYTTNAQGKKLTNEILIDEMKRTRPLSVVMAERIECLRDWTKNRTI